MNGLQLWIAKVFKILPIIEQLLEHSRNQKNQIKNLKEQLTYERAKKWQN